MAAMVIDLRISVQHFLQLVASTPAASALHFRALDDSGNTLLHALLSLEAERVRSSYYGKVPFYIVDEIASRPELLRCFDIEQRNNAGHTIRQLLQRAVDKQYEVNAQQANVIGLLPCVCPLVL